MTAIPYHVSAMLRTYGRQVTTAGGWPGSVGLCMPFDDEETQISRRPSAGNWWGGWRRDRGELHRGRSDSPVVEELKAELE